MSYYILGSAIVFASVSNALHIIDKPVATSYSLSLAYSVPKGLIKKYYDPELAAAAKEKLISGKAREGQPFRPFDDVVISYGRVPTNELDHDQNTQSITIPSKDSMQVGVGEQKNVLQKLDASPCLVYAVGIRDDSAFEQQLSERCEVHAFDCTISDTSPAVTSKNFTFHKWCIGSPNYKTKGGEFRTLVQIRALLNHTDRNIDLLKFDIESSEWALFDKEILNSNVRPQQIAFELHAWKDHQRENGVKVNKLFLSLYNIGYRVLAKELHPLDKRCAEFVLVHVDEEMG